MYLVSSFAGHNPVHASIRTVCVDDTAQKLGLEILTLDYSFFSFGSIVSIFPYQTIRIVKVNACCVLLRYEHILKCHMVMRMESYILPCIHYTAILCVYFIIPKQAPVGSKNVDTPFPLHISSQ